MLVGVWYFRDKLDEEIRVEVEKTLAGYFPQLVVRVQSAHRVEGEGIVIRGLTMTETGASGPLSELAYFEEVFLACRTELKDLLSGKLDIKRIAVRRPTFRATRRRDGSWSIEKLLKPTESAGGIRRTSIENATIVFFDPLRNPSSTCTLREVNLLIAPLPPGRSGEQPGNRVEGSLSSDLLGQIQLQGTADSTFRRWKIGGRVDGMSVSPDLVAALPAPLSDRLQPAPAIRAEAEATFRADHDPDREQPLQFEVHAQLARGRVDDSRLPFPLTDVSGSVRFTQDGVQIETVTARSGRTTFWLHGSQTGYGTDRPIALKLHANNLLLDQQLARAAPPKWRDGWHRFLPAGEVNVTAAVAFDGERWRSDLVVDCKDVSFTYYKFPYRLESGRGTLTLKNNVLTANLVASAQGRPVYITGEATNPGPAGVGRFVIQTTDLPLDARLIQALPPPAKAIVEAFAPSGRIDGFLTSQRDSPDAAWQIHPVIDLKGVAVRFGPFPYPVYDIRGRLEGVDQRWTARNLVGVNDTGLIRCQGQFSPIDGGGEAVVQLVGENMPLDDELRNAMPAHLQNVWQQLRPSGTVNMTGDVRYVSTTGKLDIVVHTDLGEQGIAIEPQFFPYRLDNLKGQMTFHPGRAELKNLTASHGRTTIAANGICGFQPDGGWSLQLSNLAVDRLNLDRDFLRAVPVDLRNRLSAVNFSGPLNLNGNLQFKQTGDNDAPVKSNWDLQFDTLQGRIDSAVAVDQIHGGFRLIGGFDGRHSAATGWLDVDSLMYKGFQVTQIQGPFWLGDDQLVFGGWAEPPRPGQPPRRISARLYGGSMVADAKVTLAETAQFDFSAQLADVDLQRFATESLNVNQNLKGNVGGNLRLQGNTRGTHTLQGVGSMSLRDGDVYQLPLMVSLLKIVTVNPSKSKAFSRANVNFRIEQNHVLFDEFNVYGDAISLLGKGEMDFDTNMRMIFHPIVGNDKLKLPIIRPVMGMAGKQLVWIYVYGTFANPKTARQALPGVRRAVEGLQAELEQPQAAPSAMRQAANWFESLLPGRQ